MTFSPKSKNSISPLKQSAPTSKYPNSPAFSFGIFTFTNLFLSLTSSVSNIGFSLNNDTENLSFIFLILVIIGGSFFSTSSGIRFLKIYSLFKYSINEILSYIKFQVIKVKI